MQPHASERRHLDRQVTYARPICLLLALVDLLELKPLLSERRAVVFVAIYLGLALALAVAQRFRRGSDLNLPIYVDLVLLLGFLLITPSVMAFWFLFLLVAFSAGINWGLRRSVLLAAGVTLALLARTIYHRPFDWQEMFSWAALAIGTFGAGAGISFLGDRNRRHAPNMSFWRALPECCMSSEAWPSPCAWSYRILLGLSPLNPHCWSSATRIWSAFLSGR